MVRQCEQANEPLGSTTDKNFLRHYNNSSKPVSYGTLVAVKSLTVSSSFIQKLPTFLMTADTGHYIL
jgi:hypothetical protein